MTAQQVGDKTSRDERESLLASLAAQEASLTSGNMESSAQGVSRLLTQHEQAMRAMAISTREK